jgi:dTDP-4-amino-4,6-dideoxygalactose transaminase
MTDIQAAIGLAQLNQLETFVQRRRSIAQNYSTAFSSLGMQLPTEDPEHIYYRYVVDLGSDTSPWQRSLLAKGVACAPPVHPPLHIYLRESGFPETEKAWKQRISIPIYPSLSDEEMDRVIQSFIQTCEEVENA